MPERLVRFFRAAIITYGGAGILCALLWDRLADAAAGMGLYQQILLITGIIILATGFFVGRRFLFPVFSLITSYLVFETLVTFVSAYIVAVPLGTTIYMSETSGKTVRFDPVRGYRLSPVPSRFARKTNGELEFVGTWKGNNEGFADRDDFSPARDKPDVIRLAVFGDSFTAAQYLSKNWPDAVEDMSHDAPVQLLNFSIDGGGIANWRSVLINIVEQEQYEIDGLVFAVLGGEFASEWNDLRRPFIMAHHADTDVHLYGRVPSWDPNQIPQSLAEARPFLHPRPLSYIVTPAIFERFIQGGYTPPGNRPLQPILAGTLTAYLRRVLRSSSYTRTIAEEGGHEPFLPEVVPLIEDIRACAVRRHLPVMVIHMPSLTTLQQGNFAIPESVLRFGEMLDAHPINGAETFRSVPQPELPDYFFRYDGHWNQKGSDLFAAHISTEIRRWAIERVNGQTP